MHFKPIFLTKQQWLVMKLTALLLTISVLQVAARGHAQQVTFTGRDVPLEKIFAVIEQQTGYVIFYNYSAIKDVRPVTIQAKGVPLQQFLQDCFKDQPYKYIIEGKTIMIARQAPAAALPPVDVKGRVVNEKGEPLAGISVTIKGTARGVATNERGEFELTGVATDAVLMFSGLNIENQEVKLNGRTELTIAATIRTDALEDVAVQVSTGYQTLNKERSVGSFAKFDSAAYHRRAGMTLLQRLDGTVPGVFFNKKTGTAPIQIRGVSTLSGNMMNPLIVVDNFPFTGDINNINPNEVQDITVLKDAVAASIWGARGGNGVIVITTKKGKYNQPLKVSALTNVTWADKPDAFYLPQMSSSDFIDVETFLFNKGYYTSSLANPHLVVISPVVELLNKRKLGQISAADSASLIDSYRKQDVRYDYEKYVYRRALNRQHYLNLNGGSGILNYSLSVGYDHNLSNIKGPGGSDQYSFKTTNNFRPARFLEFNAGLQYTQTVFRIDGLGTSIAPGGASGTFFKSQLYPYARLVDDAGLPVAIPYGYSKTFADTAGGGKLLDWHYRPLEEKDLVNNVTKTLFTQLNLGTVIKITNWLNIDLKYQYWQTNVRQQNLQGLDQYTTRDIINRYTNLSATTVALRNPLPVGAILDLAHTQSQSTWYRGQVNVHKKWQGVHEFSAIIAAEMGESKGMVDRKRFYGYDVQTGGYAASLDYVTTFPVYKNISGATRIPQPDSYAEALTSRSVSLLGNLSYNYLGRYTLYASARRDGANVFGVNTNNRWKPLWSAGIGWDIAKESFYHISWLETLKLRASYGYSGNVDNTRSGLATIRYADPAYYTLLPSAVIGAPPNPDLRWEAVKMVNAGIDFSLFKGRLGGSFELYRKYATDIISSTPVDPSVGVNDLIRNVASLKGNGFELSLNSRNPIGPFTLETGFALSYNKMVVDKYFGTAYTGRDFIHFTNVPAEGQMMWGLYSYQWAGLDPQTGDPRGYAKKQVSKDYITIFNDSIKNQVFHGSAIPLYAGYLMNNIGWKQFSLSFNIAYRLNYYYRRPTLDYTTLFIAWSGHADYTRRWQKPGDEAITNVPSMIYPANANREQFYYYSEVNVKRGDNVKLQDVRLSYNLSVANKRIPLRSANIYFYANNLNLLLWTKEKTEYDPDYSASLIRPSRTWTAGIQLQF
jgi:TonB-dependent starch-binding outer membrane protein SusC